MNKSFNNPDNSVHKRQVQDKKIIVRSIIMEVEKGSGSTITELKKKYSEERFFLEALKYVTITKKALCKALNINIDNACRYKRELELSGNLVQSADEVVCPYTRFMAHLISANPIEFERLQKSSTNQFNLFD